MKNTNQSIEFCFNITRFQTTLSRHLDAKLGGISLNELIILHSLNRAPEDKMRRTDLADKVGLTASGITRLLLPMEKIGLVEKKESKRDARVSYVKLTSGGKTKMKEALEMLKDFCEEIITPNKTKKIEDLSDLLIDMSKNI